MNASVLILCGLPASEAELASPCSDSKLTCLCLDLLLLAGAESCERGDTLCETGGDWCLVGWRPRRTDLPPLAAVLHRVATLVGKLVLVGSIASSVGAPNGDFDEPDVCIHM